jgi:hypothetical protein
VLIKTGFDDLSFSNDLVDACGVIALLVKEPHGSIQNSIARWLLSLIHITTLIQTDWSVKISKLNSVVEISDRKLSFLFEGTPG